MALGFSYIIVSERDYRITRSNEIFLSLWVKIGVLSIVPQLEKWYRIVYQKQLRIWVACLISPFCHFKGANLFVYHLGRDQCFKLEFPKEREHDLEGESLKIVLQCLYLLSNLIIWPMERVLLGFWQGFRKKRKVLQLHSELCEYMCNWATSSAAFSEIAEASCKYMFIWVVYKYCFSYCASLWVEKHLIHKEIKIPCFYVLL